LDKDAEIGEAVEVAPTSVTPCAFRVMAAAAAIVSFKVAFSVPALFVALSVTVEVPTAVGVPEINPVVLFIESPAGNPVAL
jgi:hypothetical protein